MITNPIGNPKEAILASLLMGALAITALMLRPGKVGLPADPTGLEHRDALSADAPDSPRAASLVTGKVSVAAGNRSDASHVAVLDAVRASLQRNDLASAKVLLGAEQTLYRDDPRVIELQSELQAREVAVSGARPVEHALEPSATARSSRFAWRASSRTEHGRSTLASIHERVGRASQSAQTRRAPEVEMAARTSVKPERSNPVQANPELAVASPVPAEPVAQAPSPAQPAALSPPVIHALQMTQSDPARTSAPTVSTQAPKTREQVRMEVERARADGDLPRFGNPDPAGPGGAPSRTARPVVLDW
jgi:hypothetical protein